MQNYVLLCHLFIGLVKVHNIEWLETSNNAPRVLKNEEVHETNLKCHPTGLGHFLRKDFFGHSGLHFKSCLRKAVSELVKVSNRVVKNLCRSCLIVYDEFVNFSF